VNKPRSCLGYHQFFFICTLRDAPVILLIVSRKYLHQISLIPFQPNSSPFLLVGKHFCLSLRRENNNKGAPFFSLQDHYRGFGIHHPSFAPARVQVSIHGNVGVDIRHEYIPAKFHEKRPEKKSLKLNSNVETLEMKHDEHEEDEQAKINEETLTLNQVLLTTRNDNPQITSKY